MAEEERGQESFEDKNPSSESAPHVKGDRRRGVISGFMVAPRPGHIQIYFQSGVGGSRPTLRFNPASQ